MENVDKIAADFLKAQLEMCNAKKGSINPFFHSKYADLNSVREAVLPVLNSHGISVLQPTISIDGKNYIRTILLHESGQFLDSYTEIFNKSNDAQSNGSGISYARRYGLQSMVCICADDDDANKANAERKAAEDIKSKQMAQWIATATGLLNNCKTLEELSQVYSKLTPEIKKAVITVKDEKKASLTAALTPPIA